MSKSSSSLSSSSGGRRHFVIGDTQVKKGVPIDHFHHIAKAIIDYKPDVVVHVGDHWDMPSLSSYDLPGSKKMEGARYEDDISSGNEAFKILTDAIWKESKRTIRNKKKRWIPECHYLLGNHDNRIDRAIAKEPKFEGVISTKHLITEGFVQHPFLEVLVLDGISYSHYFQSSHSSYAIGGSIDNRLNKIGTTFVQGHVQGMMYGNRMYPTGITRHGLVLGSAYQHEEEYRGPQGNTHFQGVAVLNEVKNGDFCIMPLTLNYLRDKYGN